MPLSSTDLTPESATSLEQTPFAGLRNVRSVLLCGASVRSLAESAISAGLRPLCVDFFEDQDLTELLAGGNGRFVGRIDSFAELPAVTRSVRSSIPMLWAGGLENHTNILREIAQRRPVIGADPDVIDRLRNPHQLHDWLTSAGLRMPRLATEATAAADCQWLRKPIASSGGLGIRAVTNSLLAQSSRHPIPSSEGYLQEFIDGVPMSSIFCSDQRGLQLIGTSLQLIGWPSLGASDFLFCGNVGPVEPGELISQQLRIAAAAIVEQAGLVGVFGIDFILREGQVWVLEVNPRITASHMIYESLSKEAAATINLVAKQVAACGWNLPTINGKESKETATDFGSHQTIVARFIRWAEIDFLCPDRTTEFAVKRSAWNARVADVPKPNELIFKGTPVCSVQVKTESFDSLFEATADLLLTTLPGPETCWNAIMETLRLLLDRFDRNRR